MPPSEPWPLLPSPPSTIHAAPAGGGLPPPVPAAPLPPVPAPPPAVPPGAPSVPPMPATPGAPLVPPSDDGPPPADVPPRPPSLMLDLPAPSALQPPVAIDAIAAAAAICSTHRACPIPCFFTPTPPP